MNEVDFHGGGRLGAGDGGTSSLLASSWFDMVTLGIMRMSSGDFSFLNRDESTLFDVATLYENRF